MTSTTATTVSGSTTTTSTSTSTTSTTTTTEPIPWAGELAECPGVALSDLTFLGDGVWRFSFASEQLSRGALIEQMTVRMCSFIGPDEPPSDEPPSTPGLLDSFTLQWLITPSADDAKREFEYQLPLRAGGEEPVPVSGIGDEAYLLDGQVFARKGAEMLHVGISSDDASLRQQVQEAISLVSGRYWA